jgi:exodeoxyribonuclease V alpha subunit
MAFTQPAPVSAPSIPKSAPGSRHGAGAAAPSADAILEGTLERITYQNEANGWTVGRLVVPRHKGPVTIAGAMPTVHVGETLRLEGAWTLHPQYGRQFQVARYQALIPGTIPGLKKYLGSGLLKGVGPVWAEHIVNAFGFDTLQVLEREPDRLLNIPGLGSARARTITRAWREQTAIKDLMEFLQAQGLPVALALRIVKRYGDEAARVVRTQPYRLVDEVFGVTFGLADGIATRSGLPPDSSARIACGVKHTLSEAAGEGHTWVAQADLLDATARLLNLPAGQIAALLPGLAREAQIAIEPGPGGAPVVYLQALYEAELFVAGAVRGLAAAGPDRLAVFARVDWARAFAFVREREPELCALTERQQQAVRLALTNPIMILTGGPGTGKTTTLRALIRLLQARGRSVLLAAPTGRAAKRLTEATGAPARTIHRLLDLRPGAATEYNPGAMLDADMIIVDEASMMDLPLAQALLRAVPPGSHLLLVGDPDQLPSVGPGDVLQDLLASGAVPVVKLTTIFRQGEDSGIVANAHLINAGEAPRLRGFSDFYYLPAERPEDCCALVVDLVARRLPQKYGLDPLEDIQVIAPMYQGPAGVDALNSQLQARLNPPAPGRNERHYGARIFREGDRVMQVVNDYDRAVFNGDVGRIVSIDLAEQQVRVLFDNEWTGLYAFSELDELTHAYAISVHKSQGSEYPVVVMPLLRQHGRMLQRNLLYTGISRARRLVVLTGHREAASRAVANSTAGTRNTGLRARLLTPEPARRIA